MDKLKWLIPGMRIKRWILLLFPGICLVAIGIIIFFDFRLFSMLESKLAQLLGANEHSFWLLGSFLVLLGFILSGVAIRFGIKSMISAVRPEVIPNLVGEVYKNRSLTKGPHIVVLGGGTGLATMIRGLKQYTGNITAIVTVADDGGSSGRIREEMGILPPGDIRNTLVALADTEPLMEKLFQYRFSRGEGLQGHSFGNLFIAAMTDITGDFEESIRAFGKVLAVRGKVIPSTLETVQLRAKYTDGTEVVGESHIPCSGKQIAEISMEPIMAQALPDAIEEIALADIVVLGPGSLYTSVIPNLLIDPIVEALEKTTAVKVYVCNVMTQPGETDGFRASDHVAALMKHAQGRRIFDYVLINNATISPAQSGKYQKQGAYPVEPDVENIRAMGFTTITTDLLNGQDLVRHDSKSLAEEIMRLVSEHKNL